MNKKEKSVIVFVIVIIMILTVFSILEIKKRLQQEKEGVVEKTEGFNITGNYNIDLIKKFHEVDNSKNYLISPYNIEIGLNMLRDGSSGKTKEELDKVLGNRVINDVSVKNKIGIANAVFIKDDYKNNVKKNYYNILNVKYNSEVIYDKFNNPDKINNWVKEKTNGMIDKILDDINKDFVMGLASALAIDVKWEDSFECNRTTEEVFTKINNEQINVEMMHQTYDTGVYKYFENSDSKGIIIPYEQEENSNTKLEFVGILPNDNVNEFIKNLTKEKLNNIDKNSKIAGNKLHINLSLPRFKYDYSPRNFIDILKNMGIKEAFDSEKANFKNMIEIHNYNVYVGEAIHKTHIELNEVGTKAAAITYFGMFKNSAFIEPNEYETIDINFNKPFIYMIREASTKEILFFGTVYEPNIWKGSTCNNK